MSAQIEAFEIAVRGAEAVAADPILFPLVARAEAAIAAAGRTAADLTDALLIRTLRGVDGGRWYVTLVRAAGAWSVAAVETDEDADDPYDFVGDVVFRGGEEIQVAA
ncbi:hypothetical protein CHU95_19985 [Niveispirillum lacus]|uniref:Uncharacterized protein n=1 Tax=Niveispirillum lacus TaxID=1981099 RepID=A0A255YQC8_9PROT|nr:hypothetical protein [Niveispirillum lacus]OYQ31433.1 hypothetical protein CHU95_19985 [Niveispirillum lacus]